MRKFLREALLESIGYHLGDARNEGITKENRTFEQLQKIDLERFLMKISNTNIPPL